MSADTTAAWHVLRDNLKKKEWKFLLDHDVIGLGGARLKPFPKAVNFPMATEELVKTEFAQLLMRDHVAAKLELPQQHRLAKDASETWKLNSDRFRLITEQKKAAERQRALETKEPHCGKKRHARQARLEGENSKASKRARLDNELIWCIGDISKRADESEATNASGGSPPTMTRHLSHACPDYELSAENDDADSDDSLTNLVLSDGESDANESDQTRVRVEHEMVAEKKQDRAKDLARLYNLSGTTSNAAGPKSWAPNGTAMSEAKLRISHMRQMRIGAFVANHSDKRGASKLGIGSAAVVKRAGALPIVGRNCIEANLLPRVSQKVSRFANSATAAQHTAKGKFNSEQIKRTLQRTESSDTQIFSLPHLLLPHYSPNIQRQVPCPARPLMSTVELDSEQ